uniref:VWFA domain-containing protein n=1 Tax=Parastrongyloides trichosuri TaxID=131310 RepID=A0A0N4ZHX3_PARTI
MNYFIIISIFILKFISNLHSSSLHSAINYFDRQLNTIFEQHSRFRVVDQNLQDIFNGKIENEKIDFLTDSEDVYKKVQHFFSEKIKAVQALTETAEKVSKEVLETMEDIEFMDFYPRLQDGVGQYKINEEICNNHMVKFNKSDVTGEYWKDIRGPHYYKHNKLSGIHLAVEAYKCQPEVIKDVNWTSHKELLDTFRRNEMEDKYISRQYIGTYSGVTRLYPATPWITEPKEYTFDIFDPRYRPWFVMAESAPKDVLFLLDFSGSAKGQTQHLTKMTVLNILTTLNPNDYINAVWFNSKRELVMKHCFEGFVPATSRNKRLLRSLLENLEDKDQAFVGPAIEYSYEQFKMLKDLNDTFSSNGHKIIMLFTDGVEEWPTEVINNYTEANTDNIRIFGFSMGYGVGEQPSLDWIACKTDAEYAIINSIAAVRLQSRFYLKKLSEVLSYVYRSTLSVTSRPIIFTPPYMDAQKHGAVTTLSIPILNYTDGEDSKGFIGIAAVDYKLSTLGNIINLENSNFYAFLIDNNGIVYYHPKMKLPKNDIYMIRRTACYNIKNPYRHTKKIQYGNTNEEVLKLMSLSDSISTIDIMELEFQTPVFEKFRKMMIDKRCGEVIEDGDREYRCLVLDNTPLIIGFVHQLEEPFFKLLNVNNKMNVHPSFNDITFYHTEINRFCNISLDNFSNTDKIQEITSRTNERCKRHEKIFFSYLNGLSSWVNSWYGKREIKEEGSNLCNNASYIPRDFTHEHYKFSFVQTRKHMTAVFPKCAEQQYLDYMEDLKFDFRKHRIYPKLQFVVHNDGIATSRNVLTKDNNIKLANVGVDWSSHFVDEFFKNLTIKNTNWNVCFKKNLECYIVTKDSFIIASSKVHYFNHLFDDYSLYKEMNKAGIITQVEYTNFQLECPSTKFFNRIPTASCSSIKKSIFNSFTYFWRSLIKYTLMWTFMPLAIVEGQPKIVDNHNCTYNKRSTNEYCAKKQTFFKLNVNSEKEMQFVLENNCSVTLKMYPFNESDLFLFIKNSPCQNQELHQDGSIVKEYDANMLNDCTLLKPKYRRIREDLDYTRYHYKEEPRDCPSCGWSIKMDLKIIFSILLTKLFLQQLF